MIEARPRRSARQGQSEFADSARSAIPAESASPDRDAINARPSYGIQERHPGEDGVTPEVRVGARSVLAQQAGRTGKPRMDRIAQRAHEIYQSRGGEHGKHLEDWLQAEREVDAEADQ
jgi:hypothetical protein